MVVEGVVVEDQLVVLDEEGDARVLGPRGEEDAAGPGRPIDVGHQVEASAAHRGRHLGRHGRERREVLVVPGLGVGRPVAVAGEEQLDGAVVEGEDALVLGHLPPQVDEAGQPLGLLGRPVVALGAVGLQVVELPDVVVERGAGHVAGHRLPPLGHDAPVAHHLVVLGSFGRGGVGGGQGVGHRGAADGHLRGAAVDVGGRHAEQLVDGGHDVVHVVELVAQAAGVVDAGRPVDDEGDVDPALVGVLLVPLERRVAGLGPAPRVVGVAVGPADVVDPADGLVGGLHDHVEVLHLVHDAEGPALLAGPVVREQDHDGVLQPAQPVELGQEPADLVVGVLEEGGEGLLEACGQEPLVLGQAVPRLHPGVAGGQLGPLGQQAELLLAGEPPVPGGVPAVVEPAAPPGQVLGRGLVGGVHGPEGQVGEEGTVGADRDRVVDERDGVVDQVLAEVVALLGAPGRLDLVVVVDEVGGELVGLPFQEAVEPVEAPLERPLVVGAGRRGALHGAQVPLAHGEGGVPLVAQHLGHGGGVVGDVTPHVRVAGVEVGDGPHPHGVVVPAGEQGRPGGGAQRGDVEVGVPEPAGGQGVDVGGGQVRAEAAEVGEAGVVEEDDHHVRGVLARVGGLGPPRPGLGLGGGDDAVELLELVHGPSSPHRSAGRSRGTSVNETDTR